MKRVRPEDLMNEVIAASALRRKALRRAPLLSRPSQRVWIEPFFNVLGFLWGRSMDLMPWSLRKPYVQWVLRQMASHAPETNPHLAQRQRQVVELAQRLHSETGQWPALLVGMSHPETEGPLEWLRFELMRQAIDVADVFIEKRFAGAWYKPHPRLLLAIDPFALDTVPPWVAGFYGAWMHQIYLAFDRQPSTQSWLQRGLFLRGSSFQHVGWKFLRLLRRDVPVIMALGGGLPANARLLYGAREFIHTLNIPSWKVSKRAAQQELIRLLATPEGDEWPAETGRIPARTGQIIREAMIRWGMGPHDTAVALQQLTEEFRHAVPLRRRLFRVIHARLVKRGKPLIFLPVLHKESPPYTVVAPPLAIQGNTWDFGPFFAQVANIFGTSESKG